MIRLIATDMDGTLLNEKGEVPKEFFKTIEELKERNIKFVVASGRPYVTLYENFKPISDELYYICDNGAYVVEKGNLVDISIIDKNTINSIVRDCESINNITVLLCGVKYTYHLPLEKEYEREISKYYINRKEVDNLINIDDDIFKVAICDFGISKRNSYPILNEKYGKDFMVVVSGKVWMDINNKGVSKGEALSKIQKNDNISYNETMVFGDYYNDLSMFERAKYSFAMENAKEDIKAKANYVAKSNVEQGVITTINQFILQKV